MSGFNSQQRAGISLYAFLLFQCIYLDSIDWLNTTWKSPLLRPKPKSRSTEELHLTIAEANADINEVFLMSREGRAGYDCEWQQDDTGLERRGSMQDLEMNMNQISGECRELPGLAPIVPTMMAFLQLQEMRNQSYCQPNDGYPINRKLHRLGN